MDAHTFLDSLVVQDERLASLAIEFSKVYRHLALNSTEQFLATPINVLPRGTETGRFLAIDIGGSNLRVGFMELLGAKSGHGERIRSSYEKSWPIEDRFKMDKAEELFSWIGSCIALVVNESIEDHIKSHGSPRYLDLDRVIPIGITFSFPMIQESISEAILMPMGKGFNIDSDLNLGEMLLAGYSQHTQRGGRLANGTGDYANTGIKLPEIKVAAITNDTVATLASLAYSVTGSSHSRVAMGLIVGTGTNSSIVMRLKDLHEAKRASIVLPTHSDPEDTSIVVNTEWTIKGAAPPLRQFNLINKWDEDLNRECEAPGFQPFEYMTSGRYLGEIARLAVRDYLVNVENIDVALLPEAINQRNGVSTLFLSDFAARLNSTQGFLAVLQERFPPPDDRRWTWTHENAQLFMEVASYLRTRSARLIAAAVVGLLASAGELKWRDTILEGQLADEKEPLDELIVAYAGGVISSYPGFLEICQNTINWLVREFTDTRRVKRVILRDANKGGIIGAGVLAGTVWNLPASVGHSYDAGVDDRGHKLTNQTNALDYGNSRLSGD